jgi:hypothetical protein
LGVFHLQPALQDRPIKERNLQNAFHIRSPTCEPLCHRTVSQKTGDLDLAILATANGGYGSSTYFELLDFSVVLDCVGVVFCELVEVDHVALLGCAFQMVDLTAKYVEVALNPCTS